MLGRSKNSELNSFISKYTNLLNLHKDNNISKSEINKIIFSDALSSKYEFKKPKIGLLSLNTAGLKKIMEEPNYLNSETYFVKPILFNKKNLSSIIFSIVFLLLISTLMIFYLIGIFFLFQSVYIYSDSFLLDISTFGKITLLIVILVFVHLFFSLLFSNLYHSFLFQHFYWNVRFFFVVKRMYINFYDDKKNFENFRDNLISIISNFSIKCNWYNDDNVEFNISQDNKKHFYAKKKICWNINSFWISLWFLFFDTTLFIWIIGYSLYGIFTVIY